MSDEAPPIEVRKGIGMPHSLYLQEFGSRVWDAFGTNPYQVGSTLNGTQRAWRDVDVRLILDDDAYKAMFPDIRDLSDEHYDPKWVALCMAFSELGRKMTGLPIDFQIQKQSEANDEKKYSGLRSALGFVPWRMCRIRENDPNRPASVT